MTHPAKVIDHIYNPALLFDALRKKMRLGSDFSLARALEVNPSLLSKVRHHHGCFSSALLLRIHEVTGISIRDLQGVMGERRAKHRVRKEPLASRGTSSFRLETGWPTSAASLKSDRHTRY